MSGESCNFKFVGRDGEKEKFINFVDSFDEHNNKTELLHFFGLGGIGKTSLRKEFIKHLDQQEERLYSLLDFRYEEHRNQKEALSHLGVLLQNQCPGLEFNSFIYAYEILSNKLHSHRGLNRENVPVGEGADYLLNNFIKDISEINWLNSVPKGITLIQKYTKITKEWKGRKGNKIQKELEHLDASDIENRLYKYWAEDLGNYLDTKEHRTLVVFLDTFEALKEFSKNRPLYVMEEEWIKKLVSALPQIRWVTFGREELKWDNCSENNEGIKIFNYPLKNILFEDAIELLEHNKILDGEVHKVIYETTKGLPLYLYLAIRTYKNISEHRLPTPDDFKGDKNKVVDRFLLYLTDNQRDTLQILSIPKIWTKKLFDILVHNFNNRIGKSEAKQLLDYSFITYNHDFNIYEMHDQMRTILQERLKTEEPEILIDIYKVLYKYYQMNLKEGYPKKITKKELLFMKESFEYGLKFESQLTMAKWLGQIIDNVYYTNSFISEEIEAFFFEVCEQLDINIREEYLLRIKMISSLTFIFTKQRDLFKVNKLLEQYSILINWGEEKYNFSAKELGKGEYYVIKAYLPLIHGELGDHNYYVNEAEKYKGDSYKVYLMLADIYHYSNHEIEALSIVAELEEIIDQQFTEKFQQPRGPEDKERKILQALNPLKDSPEFDKSDYDLLCLIQAHLYSQFSGYFNDNIKPEISSYFLEDVIKVFKLLLSENNEISIYAMNELGLNYMYRREFKLAIKQFENILILSEENFGKHSHLKALILINIGCSYKELGLSEKAKKYYDQALEIAETLPENVSGSGLLTDIYYYLGIWYKAKGTVPRSIRYLKKAINSYPRNYKYQIMYIYNSLIQAYMENDNYSEAEQWAVDGMNIGKSLDKNDKEIVKLAYYYVKIADKQYNREKREIVYKEIIDDHFSTREQMNNKDYPLMIMGYSNVKIGLNKSEEAVELLKKLLKNFNGDKRTQTRAHGLLGTAYSYSGNKKRADKEYSKVLNRIMESNFSKDIETLSMLKEILNFYKENDVKKYQTYLKRLSKIDPAFIMNEQ